MSELRSRVESSLRTAGAGIMATGCVIVPGLIGFRQGVENERQHNQEALALAEQLHGCGETLMAERNLLGQTVLVGLLTDHVLRHCAVLIPSDIPEATSSSLPHGAALSYSPSAPQITFPSRKQLEKHIHELRHDGNQSDHSEALELGGVLSAAGFLFLIGAAISLSDDSRHRHK